jgi:CMP-N-acetylneuraminic acid synthetase
MSAYAMIPARAGSERLKSKNLLKIKGIPVVSYGIEIAKAAGCFDAIVLNSDSVEFKEIAENNGVEFYLRDKSLAQSETTSDEVVNNFFLNFPKAEEVVWINSISPMQDPSDIKKALTYFRLEELDSLIASHKHYRHGIYLGESVNFDTKKGFARTQDLEPIELLTYTFMIWKRKSFLQSYLETHSAIMCGKFSTYPVSYLSTLAIKDESDFYLIKKIMESK